VPANLDELLSEQTPQVGVSAISLYLPKLRVSLEDWCAWTGNPWGKIKATVGLGFRFPSPQESVYTMAANACLKLILENNIDPRSIGFIALGTESSGDNAAGAIVVKGMLDRALPQLGLPRVTRYCEVPEFKHACLGGVYALKAAVRFVTCDGKGQRAIVVSSDIAEYERGSSGEPTQGAAAVAQLIEENPKLYTVDLRHAGSASSYRGVDFRKPFRRHLSANLSPEMSRFPDYPVFNGPYSTICYTDEAIRAVDRMLARLDTDARTLYRSVAGWFLHRPYHRMPTNVMAALYIWGLSRNPELLEELEGLCKDAGTDYAAMLLEAKSSPDLFKGAQCGHVNRQVYPEAMKVVKHFRYTEKFKAVKARKMCLGTEMMKQVGNVYTGSLPAWIAAGLEDALNQDIDLAGKSFFTLGYGSGDAAEAILIQVSKDWKSAAAKIGFSKALEGAIDLTEDEYNTVHDGLPGPCPDVAPSGEFVVEHVGESNDPDFHDLGIEYYRYVPEK
jgi:hydroxymethylglutaryl-CoA synthase